MSLIRVFLLCIVIISCTEKRQDLKTLNTVDFKDLNNYISDSLSITIDLDYNYSNVFDQWKDIFLISTVKNIKLSDPRQLSYTLSALKTDILKINDKNPPYLLNHPQIIGRFRVLKTNILKINLDDFSPENIEKFKLHLKDIIISHNALVKTMNSMVNKNDKVETINLDI